MDALGGSRPPPQAAALGHNITHPSVGFLFDPERDSKLPSPYWLMCASLRTRHTRTQQSHKTLTGPAPHAARRAGATIPCTPPKICADGRRCALTPPSRMHCSASVSARTRPGVAPAECAHACCHLPRNARWLGAEHALLRCTARSVFVADGQGRVSEAEYMQQVRRCHAHTAFLGVEGRWRRGHRARE